MHRSVRTLVFFVLLLCCVAIRPGVAGQWEVAWRTTGLDAPAAAIHDPATGAVYVSSHDSPGGSVAKLDPATGAVLSRHFIGDGTAASPLTAPKGLAVLGEVLFVADGDSLKAFSLPGQQQTGAWTVTGGQLSDVTLGPGRDLFVSNTIDGELYRLTWSNYTYTLSLFYGPLAAPGPLRLMGPNLLVGLGSDADTAVMKVDISVHEAFPYVDRNPGDLTPGGLDCDDAGGIFFTSGPDIRQADRDGASTVLLSESGRPAGLSYAKALGLLLVANPEAGSVTAYRLTNLPPTPVAPGLHPFAAGGEHGLALPGRRELRGFGYNSYNQASITSTANAVAPPERLDASGDWRLLAGGWQHSLGIKADGSLWGWGWNWFGQLGLGSQGTSHQTVAALSRVGTDTGWTDVSGGDAHTLAIRNGALYAFGWDDFGQIGAEHDPITPDNRPTPVLVDAGGENPWAQVAAGGEHSLALRADGSLYAWGSNDRGQLGLARQSLIDYRAEPSLVDAGPWRKVCGGGSFGAGVKADGSLWAWGENTYGQLGQGSTGGFLDHPTRVGADSDWTDLACGKNFVLALRGQGSLWGFGSNNNGQLGLGDLNDRAAPTRVGLRDDWRALACGFKHSLAMARDGKLYGFGDNGLYQLGLTGVITQRTPTPLGLGLLPQASAALLMLLSAE
ncbi:MAG: hypothetical protein ACP59X_09595 [Solidesulfovibrio sp. DCME]|uniref:RCC1 domain-containing protein n=1 Tax=Solidesulfovibrio sp. DCME TaxID=3447380 RepID=UPI003D0EC56D